VLLGRWVENYFVVGAVLAGWLGTAILLWAIPQPSSQAVPLQSMSWTSAWLIGMAQALALWPGLSRSGSTIAMARMLDIDGPDAARFSFLMAVPAVVGATLFEIPQIHTSSVNLAVWGAGALIAGVCGVIAIQWITSIVNRPHAWRGFSVYLVTACAAVWIFGG
jgi:undecaprenyl-diphosphatase